MATCNPFKVGDKVKVKVYVLRAYPRAFKNFLPVQYAVVTKVEYNSIFTDVEDTPTHFEHFEFYKEEKDMNTQTTQQTQQKTKRVPFTPELWKQNQTAKTIWTPTETEILYFDKWGGYDFIGVYKAPREEYAASIFVKWDFPNMVIEIPVTTKRIPFNPELKDAKVFYGKIELTEWFQAKTGVICGTHTIGFGGEDTSLYHPNHLEMEIDE